MQISRNALLAATLTIATAVAAQASAPRLELYGPPPQTAPDNGPQTPHGPARISGGVMAGELVSRVDPVYPAEARASAMGGSVVLRVIVGPNGAVESAVPMSGPEVFRQPAVDAVKQWTYKPYLLNGQPVEVQTTVTVNFDVNRSLRPQP